MTGQPRSFWVGLALGAPVIGFGIAGALRHAPDTQPGQLVRWIVGGAILHDGLVVPAVGIAALVAARWTPRWLWPATRWALATSAILVAVGWPFIAGYGRQPSNLSALPRDYGTGVALAVAAVWSAAFGAAVVGRLRRGRGEPA